MQSHSVHVSMGFCLGRKKPDLCCSCATVAAAPQLCWLTVPRRSTCNCKTPSSHQLHYGKLPPRLFATSVSSFSSLKPSQFQMPTSPPQDQSLQGGSVTGGTCRCQIIPSKNDCLWQMPHPYLTRPYGVAISFDRNTFHGRWRPAASE